MNHGCGGRSRRSWGDESYDGTWVSSDPTELHVRIPPAVPAATSVALLIAALPLGTAATASSFPAAGRATSGLTVLSLQAAGHALRAGDVALVSDTVNGAAPAASVVVTPLRADGTAYGQQAVTPASSPASVPAFDSASTLPAALAALITAKSPAFTVSAANGDGAASRAGATSLGGASLLGIPVALNGVVDLSTAVNGTNALAQKNVTVKNLALPSVADLVAALGLDLSKVPVATLVELVNGLNLTNIAVTTAQQALATAQQAVNTQLTAAQQAVDDQQAKVNAAKVTLASKLAALNAAQADLTPLKAAVTSAQAAFDSATTAQTTAKGELDAVTASVQALLPAGAFSAALALASPTLQASYAAKTNTYNNATSLVTTTASALASAKTAADAAQVVVDAAQAAVDAAQKLVTDLVAVLNTLLATLNSILADLAPQVNALIAAITSVLDATPLVSIDSISVQTQAVVTTAAAGGQTAKVVGGEIVGLKVLGTDVLSNVLGNTRIDVLDLVGTTLTEVTSTINGLTGTLSSVLSNVPSLPTLSIPAPQIGVLTKSTSTSTAGGFGIADNSVRALTVTIPAITLPAAVALPNAAALPGLSALPTSGLTGAAAVGDLVSSPIALSVGTLSEQSKFRPAVVAAPVGSTPGTTPGTEPGSTPTGGTPAAPELPQTGASAGLVALSLLMMVAAVVLHRRYGAAVAEE